MGKLVFGRGIWRAAHCVWIADREEARWLERFHRIASRQNWSTARRVALRKKPREHLTPRTPELPELEALVRDLSPGLLGRTIVGVELHKPKLFNAAPGLKPVCTF